QQQRHLRPGILGDLIIHWHKYSFQQLQANTLILAQSSLTVMVVRRKVSGVTYASGRPPSFRVPYISHTTEFYHGNGKR
ncbi:MAG: hypothetical protein ABL959_21570, partial [Pyrinomonadaceae bacterium]